VERSQMILDASVVAKWFLSENDTETALEIRDRYVDGDIDVEIPDLLIYELANLMRYKRMGENEIREVIDSIFSMDFLIIAPTPSLMEMASNIAISHDITIYDAVYVALGKYFGTPIITADRKLYEKTYGDYEVILLSEFEKYMRDAAGRKTGLK
jgi:predicted nucleic acid-binding protein